MPLRDIEDLVAKATARMEVPVLFGCIVRTTCLLDRLFGRRLHLSDIFVKGLSAKGNLIFRLELLYFGSWLVYWEKPFRFMWQNLLNLLLSFLSDFNLIAATFSISHERRTSCWSTSCTTPNVTASDADYLRWPNVAITGCSKVGTPTTKRNQPSIYWTVNFASFLQLRILLQYSSSLCQYHVMYVGF